VATTSLGLIAFVPFVGLAVLPLQLLAWLFRGIVFQYIGLSALGAYLHLYREYTHPRLDAQPEGLEPESAGGHPPAFSSGPRRSAGTSH